MATGCCEACVALPCIQWLMNCISCGGGGSGGAGAGPMTCTVMCTRICNYVSCGNGCNCCSKVTVGRDLIGSTSFDVREGGEDTDVNIARLRNTVLEEQPRAMASALPSDRVTPMAATPAARVSPATSADGGSSKGSNDGFTTPPTGSSPPKAFWV